MPSQYTRRGFIGISAAAAAALAGQAVFRGPAAAQPPAGIPRVLVEDITLGPQDLAASLGGALVTTPGGVTLRPGAGTGTLVSSTLTAAQPFTHLGLHWSGPGSTALAFEVRTAGATGGWSPWTPLNIEAAGKDTPSGETFAALLSTGRKSRAQFRAAFNRGGGGDEPVLDGVTLTLLNTTDGPEMAVQSATAHDPSTIGRVTYTREQWGAASPSGSPLWPPMYVPVKKVVVHHTATSNSYSTVAQAQAEVRAVYTYHAQTLGWGDIGYNVLVDKFGNSYEGRAGRVLAGGREVLSEDVVAGHAAGHNYGSAGIASLGTHTARGEGGGPGVAPSSAALNRIAALIAWYAQRRGVDPRAESDFMLLNETWKRGLANVCGHRDCVATVCPGGQLQSQLPWLRSTAHGIAARTNAPSLTATHESVLLGSAASVGFNWSPISGQYVLEGWRRATPTSEDIVYLSGYTADRLPAAYLNDTDGATTLGTAFAAFKNIAALEPGRYTLHVRSSSGGSYRRERTVLVQPGGEVVNGPPTVSITAPPSGSTYTEGDTVTLSGTASDAEDGDLSPQIAWSSSLDGALGTGASMNVTLNPGNHIITASVQDSAGASASAQINVSVEAAGGGGPSIQLSATGFKDRGLQKADLSWSGATSTNVDIFRNNSKIATVANSGAYRDHIDARGSGSYTYRVNEAGTAIASNEVVVTF